MSDYTLPALVDPPVTAPRTVYTVASGDLRLSANVTGWPTQQQLEADLAAAVGALGWDTRRAHPVDTGDGARLHRQPARRHRGVPADSADAPLVVVEAVWQYSHHVLAGLRSHRGPILLVANWSGQFPGLVGLLNLAGSLTKAGVRYSALWSEDFTDEWARDGLQTWLETGERAPRRESRARPAAAAVGPGGGARAGAGPPAAARAGRSSASSTRAAWACTTRSSTTSCSTRSASSRSGCRRARSWRR